MNIRLKILKLLAGYKTKDQYARGLRHFKNVTCNTKTHKRGFKFWNEYKKRCINEA